MLRAIVTGVVFARFRLAGLVGLVGLVSLGVLGQLTGCSSESSTSSSGGTPTDSGTADGSSGTGGDSGSDAGGDAGAVVVNSCKTFDDRTATGASRTIAWQFPLPAADRCIEIKVGQSVTWNGDFAKYGVAASKGPAGGDSPNPISAFDPTAPTVKFPSAGTFGFESPDAPALTGAVKVSE